MHACMHACMHRQTDKQTDRQKDRQTDRQTYIYIYVNVYVCIIFGAVHVKLLGGFQPRIPEGRSHQKISTGHSRRLWGLGRQFTARRGCILRLGKPLRRWSFSFFLKHHYEIIECDGLFFGDYHIASIKNRETFINLEPMAWLGGACPISG